MIALLVATERWREFNPVKEDDDDEAEKIDDEEVDDGDEVDTSVSFNARPSNSCLMISASFASAECGGALAEPGSRLTSPAPDASADGRVDDDA